MSRLRTTFTQVGRNERRWYFVWDSNRLIWQGSAQSASDARGKAKGALASRQLTARASAPRLRTAAGAPVSAPTPTSGPRGGK